MAAAVARSGSPSTHGTQSYVRGLAIGGRHRDLNRTLTGRAYDGERVAGEGGAVGAGVIFDRPRIGATQPLQQARARDGDAHPAIAVLMHRPALVDEGDVDKREV